MPSDKSLVKEQVLRRAAGRCERCAKELGDTYHFHFQGYPVLHIDNLIAVCPACHRELLAKRHPGR